MTGANTSDPAVAVDLGGTNVRAALIRPDLTVANLSRRPLDRSGEQALLEVIGACVDDALSVTESPSSSPAAIVGIGAAIKGFVDNVTGITVSSGFLGMKNVPVGPYLSERFGVPAYVANDVQAATIGEMFYGAGRHHSHFVYLNVGTGIAAGLVFGRRLYRGGANLSGEFGHVTVDHAGDPCPCGRNGCLEQVVSGPGIINQAKAAVVNAPDSLMAPLVESGEINATAVFALADGGDNAATRVRDFTVAYLGDGIANLVNVLNPEAIILGGGVFHNAGSFVERLEAHVRSVAIREAVASMSRFEISELEADKAGLIGAAGLVFEHQNIE